MEKLGDILLLERLAAGGMAEIFRAKQYGLNGFEKTVALKRVLPNHTSKKEFLEMFKAEANLSAQLQHPNIAQVFSNGQHGSYFYLIMELVEGKNLKQLQLKAADKGVKILTPLICYAICEVAKGLDYAHNLSDEKTGESLNIVHRDVNHHNIMLSYEGAIKVIDFGVAKSNDEDRQKTKAGVLKGKVSYMSPEQVRGRKIDRRTDIFSLGIVMWELLTGQNLFLQDEELSTLESIRECVVPTFEEMNVSVPPELEKIVRKALEREPTARYANAKELYSDLQKFLNEKYPAYFQSDVATFMKELFKEEIAEERQKKDKLNQEAKLFLSRNPILRPSKTKIFGEEVQKLEPRSNLSVEIANSDRTLASLNTQSQTNVHARMSQSKSLPGWTQSSGSLQNTRFEYDQSSSTNVYSSSVQNHTSKLVVFLLVIAVGVIYMWFQERERLLFASFENSRNEPWSEGFRGSFIASCSSEDIIPSELSKVEFCLCLAKPVENAHVLFTKYNPNLITEEAHSQINLGEFRKFMRSPAGEEAKYGCLGDMSGN